MSINPLSKYIDNTIIHEYADKNISQGYSLDISSLTEHEKSNFVHMLMQHDPVFQDQVSERMQELIEERIPFVESQDNYDSGLIPKIDKQTGEVQWCAA
jgi:hypothetical protein